MRNEIILIGPMLAGKSTIATIFSNQLKIPVIRLDEIKWKYFKRYGFTQSYADKLLEKKGIAELMKYSKPYEAKALEQILFDYKNCIFDFGAGFTIYDFDVQLQNRINIVLKEYINIFLVLPTEDKNVNSRIFLNRLKNRINNDPELEKYYDGLYELTIYFGKHAGYKKIAKNILYTHCLNETQIIELATKMVTV